MPNQIHNYDFSISHCLQKYVILNFFTFKRLMPVLLNEEGKKYACERKKKIFYFQIQNTAF